MNDEHPRRMPLKYDDQPDFTRSPAICRLKYRPAGGGPSTEGACLNVSGSGILFTGEMSFEAGRAVEVRLVSENKITPPLTVYIEVLRCRSAANGVYEIAGAINGIKST